MSATARLAGRMAAAAATVVAVILLLMLLAGTFEEKVRADGTGPKETAGGSANTVEVVAVDLPQYEWAVGTVQAVHETTLGARLLASVRAVHVEAGQEVEAGEVLVELDDRDLDARLARAEAELAATQAVLDQAKTDYERISKLAASGSASPYELTSATNTLRSAQAEHQRSVEAKHEAEAVLSYATIRAPVAGRIVDKLVEVGDIVTAGQPLVTMYDPTRMQLVASVRESLRRRLEVGQSVQVKLDVLDHACEATVSEIVPEAETASRTFQVKVTGPCPPGVYPGMFGRLRIPVGTRTAVRVPEEAIQQVGQLDLVHVEDGNTVRRRLVRLGRETEGGVEVISGLRPGERVVLPEGNAEVRRGD